MHHHQISFSQPLLFLSILLLLHSTTLTLSQTLSPGPSGPTNITKILEKAGQFTTLIRLMKTTQISDQINTQLNNTNNNQAGLTLFAPTDNAFSNLPSGTLNSLTDQQKVSLIQFHILPSFVSMAQFQTVSNPMRTQAGDSANGAFPLNVTTSGNQVNVSTGVDDATVANTIYTDGELAVYQVDKVLLPLSMFGAPSPAAAPASDSSEKKKKKAADGPVAGGDGNSPVDASGGHGGGLHGISVMVIVVCLVVYGL